MNKFIVFLTIVAGIVLCNAAPAPQNDGKYHPHNDGKYHPESRREGQQYGYTDSAGVYHHAVQPYMHVHDNRELGKYVHIPNPYGGGYGPYSGSNLPYMHDVKPYVHDVKPYDHNLYTTTTTKKPTTTTERTTTTTTTTTTTPRSILFNYDDEGRHKILHQEDARKHDKYDHAYLTENGIYGEEQAKLHHAGGTHAQGYYEYTGDDGKLYRVNYKSTHEGFMPEGDHIPTPPPIPAAIARALKYVDDKRKENGEKPLFDERGFRIDHMSKDMVKSIKSIHIENMPRDIAEQIHELQLEMEALYGPNAEGAEDGSEVDAEEETEVGAEEGVERGAEEGSEKDAEEDVEKGAEEDVENIAEEGAEKVAEEVGEKGTAEVAEKANEEGAQYEVQEAYEEGAEEDHK